jgi:hypothetical protein
MKAQTQPPAHAERRHPEAVARRARARGHPAASATGCAFVGAALLFATMAGPVLAEDAIQLAATEAARQDMVATQLAELGARFGDLLADLSTNRGVGADVANISASLRDRITTIGTVRLGHARKLIDEALRSQGGADASLAAARQQIVLAARELGSLLLQAGIAQACEVFATELREIISRQEALLAASLAQESAANGARAAAQAELVERTAALLAELAALRDAPTDAWAAVRLARARKILDGEQVVAEMKEAGTGAGQPGGGADHQAKALRGLRQGLLKLRPDARLEELVRARNLVRDLTEAQQALRTSMAGLSAAEFAARQAGLKLKQEAILRPLLQLEGPVVAPGQGSLDIGAPVEAARQAGQEALAAIGAGQSALTATAQGRIEAALLAASLKLGEQIARFNALGETHRRMLEAADRLRALAELRDRAEQVKNLAFEAAAAGKDLQGAASAQEQLGRDLGLFATNMPESSSFVPVLRRPLKKAVQAAARCAANLRTGKLETAVPEFAKAEQAVKEATDAAKREVGVLEKLWLFRQAAADIRQIHVGIEDVEAEQSGLERDVEKARAGGRTVLDLTGPQALLARATQQIEESAGTIREAALMKEPLEAAIAAMNKSAGLLERDQAAPALEAQQAAAKALHEAHAVAAAVIAQIDLIVVEIAASSELSSRAMDLLQRQIVLRETTEEAEAGDFARLAGEQDILLAETDVLTGLSVAPKAAEAFKQAADEMRGAIAKLKAAAQAPAVEHQKKAEAALRAGILALDEYILSLMALLGSGSAIVEEYITAMDGLTAILLLATEQRELRELTLKTPDPFLHPYAAKQLEFRQRADAIAQMPNILSGAGRITGWEHVEAAGRAMEKAVATLKAREKNPTIEHQQLAEKELRIAFAMNVVELIMALRPPPPPGSGQPIPVKLRDVPVPISLDHWFEFSKASPSGKLTTGGKSEWNSLMDRERAALNENFARELPLEFRKLLKDYYEALAK